MNSTQYKTIEVARLEEIFGGDSSKYLTTQYDPADVYLETEDEIIIAEYKTRNCGTLTYEKEGYVLELHKAKALSLKAQKAKLTGKKVTTLYINYFTRTNETAIWDLKDQFENKKVIVGKGRFNKTTASDFRRSGEKVNKVVYYLKVANANQLIKMK